MNSAYAFFENLASEIPEIPPDSIISRTIYGDEQVKVVLFGFAQGQELSEHTASQAALLPPLPLAHGPLMVSGFLGTLIALERAVALRARWTYIGPLLTSLGGLFLALGVGGEIGRVVVG